MRANIFLKKKSGMLFSFGANIPAARGYILLVEIDPRYEVLSEIILVHLNIFSTAYKIWCSTPAVRVTA